MASICRLESNAIEVWAHCSFSFESRLLLPCCCSVKYLFTFCAKSRITLWYKVNMTTQNMVTRGRFYGKLCRLQILNAIAGHFCMELTEMCVQSHSWNSSLHSEPNTCNISITVHFLWWACRIFAVQNCWYDRPLPYNQRTLLMVTSIKTGKWSVYN